MGAVFSSQFGSTIGMVTEHVRPGSISIVNDPQRKGWLGNAGAIAMDAGMSAGKAAWEAGKQLPTGPFYNIGQTADAISAGIDTLEDWLVHHPDIHHALAQAEAYWTEDDFFRDQIPDRKNRLTSDADKRSPMENSLYDSLVQGRWGFITHIQGGFKEPFERNRDTVETFTDSLLGDWSIHGLAFSHSCETSGVRHGIEGPLYWYWYNRSSYDFSGNVNVNRVRIRVGTTRLLDCFVVGVDVAPRDLNFGLWSWTINLAVSPDYAPKPLPGA
jgi:hypothetical protein